MTYRNYDIDITISSGATVSSAFSIAGIAQIGLVAPVITSAQMFLQVSASPSVTEPTSATFVRLANQFNDASGLGLWTWPIGPGVAAATVDVSPWDWARLESSPAQVALVIFKLVGKRLN